MIDVVEYSRFSSSSVAFLFLFFSYMLAFVDKSFYFIGLDSLSFRVIFAGRVFVMIYSLSLLRYFCS